MKLSLSIQEVQELLNYIMEHNSWLKMYDNNCIKGLQTPSDKYVDFSFDTRTGDVWRVAFRNGGEAVEFRANEKVSLKEQVYQYLKTEKV